MAKRFARVASIAAILTLGALGSEARAESITLAADSTTTFDVSWSLLAGDTELTAFGTFTVIVDGDSATFLITLTNNTDSTVNEAVHSIGFNIDPNAATLSDPVAGAVFQNFALYQNFPSYQTIDICTWASNTCSGGAQGSTLSGGTSDTFGFTLHGDFSEGLTLSNFAIKFKGDLGSYQLTGTPTTVPEYGSSASFLLISLGFVAAFGKRRRR